MKRRPYRHAGALIVGILATILGAVLVLDRPGLEMEYFAGAATDLRKPSFTTVGQPQLDGRDEVADVLVSQEIFNLQWHGWLLVTEEGEYRFRLQADEVSYLSLGGQRLAETSRESKTRETGSVELAAGIHPIEMGFTQTGGRAQFAVSWWRPGSDPELLQGRHLLAHRPVVLRSLLRGLPGAGASGWPGRLFGGLLLCLGLFGCSKGVGSMRSACRRAFDSYRVWLERPANRRAIQGLFLLLVFLGSCVLSFPFTATTTDGDDIRYMDAARFDKQMGWNMNRYGHIYLLKAFIWWADGDAFLASRIHWSFVFGVTVLALAVAVGSLGPGLQVSALAVSLFLFLGQTYLFLAIGASYAEYSAMMFVTLAVAVYLQGHRDGGAIGPFHLAALGALSVAAAKSKEPGLIVLWLAVTLLWSGGRFDPRGFTRRIAWWLSGAVGAYLLLMTLDAVVLGDFWFSLRLESVAGAKRLKDAAEGIWQLSPFAWLDVAWTAGPLRRLSALAIVVGLIALVRQTSAERRVIAWMPLVFMAMMIAIHPAISSARYLIPIMPVTCLAAALMFQQWRSSSVYKRGLWAVKPWLLVAALLMMFGSGFVGTGEILAKHWAVQKGDWTLYPWEVFRQEIENERPKEILISPRLYRTYQMMGQSKTRDRIARLYFQRRHLKLRESKSFSGSTKLVVVTRVDFKRWLRQQPEISKRAVFDSSGKIVLVRPE